MTDAIPCPTCQAIVPIEAQFCPGCGRPRTIVERRLRDEAKRLRVSYAEVLAFEQVVEQRRGVFERHAVAAAQLPCQRRIRRL